MRKYDAVIAGYICLDLTPDFKKGETISSIPELFKPGKLIEIDGLSFLLGGAVANTGMAMKRFGRSVLLNGLVGEDFMGKIVIDWLAENNLSEGIAKTSLAGTAFSIVLAPHGIDRIFLEYPGCNQIFDKRFVNLEAVSQCRIFHLGYPPLLKQFYQQNGALLVELFAEIQHKNVVTSLDFSLPDPESESGKVEWPVIMNQVLPYTDIFVPSLEEAFQIMLPEVYKFLKASCQSEDILDFVSMQDIRLLGKTIRKLGVKILLIKAGHRGAYLLTGDVTTLNQLPGFNLPLENWNDRELWCDAFPADESRIVNATGAGDTAIAAFLSAILNNETAEASLKYAALAGRNKLYATQVLTELAEWEEMKTEIESENPDNNLNNCKITDFNTSKNNTI